MYKHKNNSAHAIADKPLLFAHRGSTILAPENTQAAFDLALQYKSDVLEIDVRLSRDGHVIVTHDETLERTTNGIGTVRSHTLQALKKLDAGYSFIDLRGRPYRGQNISLITLPELLEIYPDTPVNIDIKDNDTNAALAVASVLNKVLATTMGQRWLNVGSFHESVISHFRVIAPHISTAASRVEVARLYFGEHAKINTDHVSKYQYNYLQIPRRYCGLPLDRQRFIDKVHQRQLKIVFWTINDAKTMSRLLMRKADGLVTDRPDIALDEFQKLGFKSAD